MPPMPPRRHTAVAALAAGLLLTATAASGCSLSTLHASGGRVRVVAAEDFWGSIARQIGGAHAEVTSIVVNPAQDPHAYEPTTSDARTMATAQLAIVNGVGYDPWAPRLLAANPVGGRTTLTVGRLLRLGPDANPHRWYDPADVTAVAAAIARALTRAYPAATRYFAGRLAAFDHTALSAYHALIATIRRRYAGTPVGASESIFALQAPALGLDLITPPGFMKAISEGTEVTPQDTIATERQATGRRIRVWVFNAQNVTPEVERLNGLARAAGIPIVPVTETLSPARDSFQQWQTGQLTALAAALHRVTGR